MITHKVCKSCGENLEVSNFTKSKNVKDGYENKCKICRANARKKYINICSTCGSEYKTPYKNTQYCSQSCKPQSQKKRILINCSFCGSQLERTQSQIDRSRHHYCSDICKNNGYRKLYSGKNSVHYNREIANCSFCDRPIFRTKYEIDTYEHLYCTSDCKIEHYKILFSGKNNPNYNPNKSEQDRMQNRNIEGYREWIRKILEKDNYTCQCCDDNRGGNLVAHHILNYSEHDELRTDVNNGITLCKTCHKLFHDTYGYRNNNEEQLKEFLNKHKNQAS